MAREGVVWQEWIGNKRLLSVDILVKCGTAGNVGCTNGEH
jgi:hypothetical protein